MKVFTVFTHFLMKISLALALFLLVSGCVPPPFALMLIPTTGESAPKLGIQVNEYPVVEQSIDSPTHAGFQARVPDAVNAIRGAWRLQAEESISDPNQVLERFGYRLETNPAPPFSGYALFHGSLEIQRDIARFWPVSVREDGQAQDFQLAFETISGERLVASSSGIDLWPGQQPLGTGAPPVYYQGRIAYAQTAGSEINVMAGSDGLYAGMAAQDSAHQDMQLALERDRQADNPIAGYDEVFHWQHIDGNPFYFFTEGGLTYISYAGEVQPFYYDHVIHGNQGETSQFNPGSNHRLVWFYALRDGLWYYVEVQAR